MFVKSGGLKANADVLKINKSLNKSLQIIQSKALNDINSKNDHYAMMSENSDNEGKEFADFLYEWPLTERDPALLMTLFKSLVYVIYCIVNNKF